MTIEEELFQNTKVDIVKLLNYGFRKVNDRYRYIKKILTNSFAVTIKVDFKGNVKSQVYDLVGEDEYTSFRITNNMGSLTAQVKEKLANLLIDIRNNCFTKADFKSEQANRIALAIKDKFGDNPEFLWQKLPGYAIFRNLTNRKWYALIMNISKSKLGKGKGEVEILNLKLTEEKTQKLLQRKGFYPSYHMKKADWITIVLDDTIADTEIMQYVSESHQATEVLAEWIIPANPKYYDMLTCFDATDTIIWKQSSNIKVNDIVYIYVGSPYSALFYKCQALEVNISYSYQTKDLTIKNVMRIKLIKKYVHDEFPFARLKELGVRAIRGPRLITKELSDALNKE